MDWRLQAFIGLHDLSRVTSVASFYVSRVDTLLDKMLEKIGTPEALNRQGKGKKPIIKVNN
ncbi:putative transaldolase [Helianthus anomalus]